MIPVFGSIGYTQRMWILFNFFVIIFAIIILIKNKFPNKNNIISSLILGALMFVAYEGFSFSSFLAFFSTTICSLATFTIFINHPNYAIPIVKSKKIYSIILSIFIAILVGITLGTINLFISGQKLSLNINLSCFLTALSPAIFEEVCFRFFIYALCIYLLKGNTNTKTEKFWCYFMMVVPHAIIHTPEMFINYGAVSGIIGTIMLSLLFGLPFALLQKKRDLTSAMIAHGIVDVIRFCFIGLPF